MFPWNCAIALAFCGKENVMTDLPVIERPPVVEAGQPKTEEPKSWVVVVHNDHTTPFQDVADILQRHFAMAHDRAFAIMMYAHHHGEADVQIYQSQDVAETKADGATRDARSRKNAAFGGPLELTFSAHRL
jgi:ATP-dependent Clp protease adapter protein ClpS